MGLLSREARRPKLPLYKGVAFSRPHPPSPTKERYSDDEYSTCSDTDSDILSPTSSRNSRKSSNSSSVGLMQSKKKTFASRGPTRRYLCRLPNKVVRWLCIGMMTVIIFFIMTLIRASQLENRRIAEGKVSRPAPPPAWESFEFLTRYYGGIRTLIPFADNIPQYPKVEDEKPPSSSATVQGSGKREAADEKNGFPKSNAFQDHPVASLPRTKDIISECFLDDEKTVAVPPVRYFNGRPSGFPDHVVGSYELFSLPEDVCFERFGRYGPYGYGYPIPSGGLGLGEHGDREGSEQVWQSVKQVDWLQVDWASVQQRCYEANANRFKPLKHRGSPPHGFYIGEKVEQTKLAARAQTNWTSTPSSKSTPAATAQPQGDMPRTAVVVRCWDEFKWNEDSVMNLRALISELSLASGGRYDIHLLVQVKNDAAHPIWADDETYRAHIEETVPGEFRNITTLWSVTQMLAVYQGIRDLWTRGPSLPVHGEFRGLQMAVQLFAYNHPEYDYFWQWEMDIRYTGHYYDLLTKMENWAKQQPRKGLWERNARFYVPDVHGSWEDFKQMARVQTEHGTLSADNIWDKVPGSAKGNSDPHRQTALGEESVWGPRRPVDRADWFESDRDPQPPTTYERDKYKWGVGEEAELITMNPIFDPAGTTWNVADDITGYNETGTNGKPPRRAHIISAARMSRRLLLQMHRETAFKKHHAFPEMWPATVALHHGYKAVYAPHPVFVDREWPVEYMTRVLNGGRNGASGGARASVFGDREHNMRGMTWFYNSGFSGNLYRRWLGLRSNNDGGEQFELTPDMSKNDTTVNTMRGGEGRMCLPPMLLHPIKDVDLPVVQSVSDATHHNSDTALDPSS
ncbi:hypothetical protein B0T14DRAFT_502520 [Immersiella caudata]|uniref:Uncharacterized protein n=1 Tax=Immersiella caudata TaxID=314043 RepID=A0AA39XDA8_9PEZI|nr:hypothetical protein B0T14DRAFT_502520 [Immersiella caudata]